MIATAPNPASAAWRSASARASRPNERCCHSWVFTAGAEPDLRAVDVKGLADERGPLELGPPGRAGEAEAQKHESERRRPSPE